MIGLWVILVLLQGGEVGVVSFSTLAECDEERPAIFKLQDALAVSQCLDVRLMVKKEGA